MNKFLFVPAVAMLALAAAQTGALAQSATSSSPSQSSAPSGNPGTAPSGGTASPNGSGHGSASAGTTQEDVNIQKQNEKTQSICKGC